MDNADKLKIIIACDNTVIKMERKTIKAIHDLLYDNISEADFDSDACLTYNAYTVLDFHDISKIKDLDLQVKLHKDSGNIGMQGDIYRSDSILNGIGEVKGSIHISETNVTGEISIEYGNCYYHGDIIGESVYGGFTPIFTCTSELHCDNNDSAVHLECRFDSVITEHCSDYSIYRKLANLCKSDPLPYSKYISGWAKIGGYYRYISPRTHTSVEIPKGPGLSSESVNTVLEYINNDMCLPVFFHSLRSIILRFIKPECHAALNVQCYLEEKREKEVVEYISSIVDCFDSPNIKRRYEAENFALNQKFKIAELMPEIAGTLIKSSSDKFQLRKNDDNAQIADNKSHKYQLRKNAYSNNADKAKINGNISYKYQLRKDSKRFKNFPVFLFGEYRKKDIFNVNPPIPSLKTKIKEKNLKNMLNSDISYIFLNADNDDEKIMNFNFYAEPMQIEDTISDDLRYLIREYIVYLEDNMNCTRIISRKNKKLIRLHEEILYEIQYNAFGNFLNHLALSIYDVKCNSLDEIRDYITLFRHIKYSDVTTFYNHVKYTIEDRNFYAEEGFNVEKYNIFLNSFFQDIIDNAKITKSDEQYLYNKKKYKKSHKYINILTLYFKALENNDDEISPNIDDLTSKSNVDELWKSLIAKFAKYIVQYHERLIAQFAASMKYNTAFFKNSLDYAEKAMKAHKQECGKPTLKYCTSLLAAAHGFMHFLHERYDISEDICFTILKRVENLYKVLSYSSELRVPAPELKVQMFRNFLEDCRKFSAKAVGVKKGWSPIYTEEDAGCIMMNGKTDSIQPIGWYDINKSEFVLIKKGENSPVEVAFKKYLEKRQYDPNFIWSTFVSSELYPNEIAKGRIVPKQKCRRYDYRQTVEGKQYTVYRMKG